MNKEPIKLEQDPLKARQSKLYFLLVDKRNLIRSKISGLYLLSELDRDRGIDEVYLDQDQNCNSMSLKYCEKHEIPVITVESDTDFVKKIRPHKMGKLLAYLTTKKREDIETIVEQLLKDSFSINIREKF